MNMQLTRPGMTAVHGAGIRRAGSDPARGVTIHARARMQQRGLPPMIRGWLEDYGSERYDGRGARVLYFDKAARRRIERDLGREPVRRMEDWLDAYLVVDDYGIVITVGRRYARLWRRS